MPCCALIARAGVTDASALAPVGDGGVDGRLALWRGDITTLAVDAIVNAANSKLLGCFIPGHHCIDNAIHTFAGMQLRLVCDELMRAQGHDEPVGRAQVTSAFNLPSRFVVHTVGPQVPTGEPTAAQEEQLASCYRASLDAAAAAGVASLAFCCISTGEFRFPRERAARIAVGEVRAWLARDERIERVVFNVFGDEDERVYREVLG
ncbi:MAG: protein-ADP-ribose hydrolase [Eggerthella lenta]